MTRAIHAGLLALSGSLAASVAAKTTVIISLGLIAVRLAPRSRAAVRHALLAAAFGVLLVLPVASLVAPPIRIALPVVTQGRTRLPPFLMSSDAIPAIPTRDRNSAAPRSSMPLSFPPWTAGWLAGTLLSLLPMIAGVWRIRSLCRSSLPWRRGNPPSMGWR